jgi:hypothetical protein
VRVAELVVKLVLVWKAAVMVWVPRVRAVVEKVATPLLFRVPVPSRVVPSEKLTVPDTTPVVAVVVAVKVTVAPTVAGELEVVRVVTVATGLIVSAPGWMVAMYLPAEVPETLAPMA